MKCLVAPEWLFRAAGFTTEYHGLSMTVRILQGPFIFQLNAQVKDQLREEMDEEKELRGDLRE